MIASNNAVPLIEPLPLIICPDDIAVNVPVPFIPAVPNTGVPVVTTVTVAVAAMTATPRRVLPAKELYGDCENALIPNIIYIAFLLVYQVFPKSYLEKTLKNLHPSILFVSYYLW